MYLVRDNSQILNLRLKSIVDKDHDIVREDARALMAYIQAKSQEFDPDRKVRACITFPFLLRH